MAVLVYGILRLCDGGGGLEGKARRDGRPHRDATLDAAGIVLGKPGTVSPGKPRVVVLRAAQSRAGKAGADLEALAGGNREHGLSQKRFGAIEDRLSEARRGISHVEPHHAAHRIAVAPGRLDRRFHAGRGLGVRAAHQALLDHLRGDRIGIDHGLDRLHGFYPGKDLAALS